MGACTELGNGLVEMTTNVSSDFPFKHHRQAVLDAHMSYVDEGRGESIVFLHGNPTSSYLWRNVMPTVIPHGRCIAPDLIGMGESDKLVGEGDERYSFHEHQRYLDALFEQLQLGDDVVLVIHDWGSALGFEWARRFPERVRGIVYMEALVCPVTWDDWPEGARGIFQGFRSTKGEDLILERNLFIEGVLPSAVIRDLDGDTMDAYRAPYLEAGEARRALLAWPRQLPMNGEPPATVTVAENIQAFMSSTAIPKLFINADPGSILVGRQREICRQWPNQAEVTVAGNHFIQEDSPTQIGAAVVDFLKTL